MEKFHYEKPSIERKTDALDFIDEFHKYNSNINGVGGLDRYLNDYEGWLKKQSGILENNGSIGWI